MIEVRIPISPVDHYFNRVHFIAHSIRALGGPYAKTRIRVSVGSSDPPFDLHQALPWSTRLGIDWHWVDRAEYAAWAETSHPYIATMMERFRPPFGADTVLMLDADVAVMRPFPELLDLIDANPGVVGVMAHGSPFPADNWRTLFRHAGLAEPEMAYEASGWGTMEVAPDRRYSPAYFNTGVVLAPGAVLERLYDPYMAALHTVRSLFDTYFFEQIALTLALYQTGIPFHIVPPRYNYPNHPAFDAFHPEELREVCFLHFLRGDIVPREASFATWKAMQTLARRKDLRGSNAALRQRLGDMLAAMRADYAGGALPDGLLDRLRRWLGRGAAP